jgi:hypothetical protein
MTRQLDHDTDRGLADVLGDVKRVQADVERHFPGAAVVDVRRPADSDGHAEAPARPGNFSLAALAAAGRAAADEVRRRQQRLVDHSVRAAPAAAAMCLADHLDALASLAERVRTDRVIIDRLRALGPPKPAGDAAPAEASDGAP